MKNLTAGQTLLIAIDARKEIAEQKTKLIGYGFELKKVIMAQVIYNQLLSLHKKDMGWDEDADFDLKEIDGLPIEVVGTEGRFKSRGGYILPITVTYHQPAFVQAVPVKEEEETEDEIQKITLAPVATEAISEGQSEVSQIEESYFPVGQTESDVDQQNATSEENVETSSEDLKEAENTAKCTFGKNSVEGVVSEQVEEAPEFKHNSDISGDSEIKTQE